MKRITNFLKGLIQGWPLTIALVWILATMYIASLCGAFISAPSNFKVYVGIAIIVVYLVATNALYRVISASVHKNYSSHDRHDDDSVVDKSSN